MPERELKRLAHCICILFVDLSKKRIHLRQRHLCERAHIHIKWCAFHRAGDEPFRFRRISLLICSAYALSVPHSGYETIPNSVSNRRTSKRKYYKPKNACKRKSWAFGKIGGSAVKRACA